MSVDAWLRLAAAGLHPERVGQLLDTHGGVVGALRAVEETEPVPSAEECRARLERWGGVFELAAGAAWSERFVHVADAPRWLFREGPLEGSMVAIVGTRACTEYGRRTAAALAAAAVEKGWTVVSGLARGIDAAAHRGALEGGGTTVAVLGSGPDVPYPRNHGRLRTEITASGGAVVTEYAPGAPPLPWRFPPRNRIISGLSEAVIVVESGERGGSLSTAARAVAQARPLFAVPGDVDRVASVGCNRLIRDGAIPVLGPEDLSEALDLLG